MEAAIQRIEDYEEDTAWLFSNIKEMRKVYPNKFVAVKDRRVIDSDVTIGELLRKLKKKKEDPATLVVEFIPKEEVAMIL